MLAEPLLQDFEQPKRFGQASAEHESRLFIAWERPASPLRFLFMWKSAPCPLHGLSGSSQPSWDDGDDAPTFHKPPRDPRRGRGHPRIRLQWLCIFKRGLFICTRASGCQRRADPPTAGPFPSSGKGVSVGYGRPRAGGGSSFNRLGLVAPRGMAVKCFGGTGPFPSALGISGPGPGASYS